jgi:hypothetical protein
MSSYVIQLTENIPTHDGKEYPYLAVEQLIGTFPIATEQSARTASVRLTITPFRIVQAGDESIRIAHPTAQRTLTIHEYDGSVLAPMVAPAIALHIEEWASATVVEVPDAD